MSQKRMNPDNPKCSQFDVYFNLHKKLFSLKSRYTGRVTGHADTVLMENVQFKVSEAGRQRVLREKRKNVHAFVRGELVCEFDVYKSQRDEVILNGVELTYNPYKYSTFVVKESGNPVYKADKVVLIGKKIFAILHNFDILIV